MPSGIGNLWSLGGLSLPEVLRRTARESWADSVFGQGGRMAFYHFLAIFPSLLLFLAISSHAPHLSDSMKSAMDDMARQVLPDRVAQLFQTAVQELNGRALSGIHFVSVCAGTLWAALNATWAMIYGLNRAYEVQEQRPWWKLSITICGLTLALAALCLIAMFLIFCGAYFQKYFHAGILVLRAVEWLVLVAAVLLWFAVLYRFAPDLRDHEWRWSTPGALCALLLWIAAALIARLYFDRVNDYSRTYGHLNGVVMLLLWLYVSNGAILVGGEMNSEIEKAAAERGYV